MNFEKYGNKLINLLTKLERYLEPDAHSQIGGSDGIPHTPSTSGTEPSEYVKVLSYSINHISVLVHLDKMPASENIENPQISYKNNETEVNEYSIEQQLRLGCDNNGDMYNFSVVLTFDLNN